MALKKLGMSLLIGMFFLIGACSSDKEENLTIAVSSNMQYATEDLVKAFEEETGISCELIVGSSGKLTAQVLEGAPFHVLLSADMKYPEEIFLQGKAVDKPIIYGYGQLVFWTSLEDFDFSSETLSSEKVNHIAVANPKTAPYGRAAVQLLKNMDLYNEIKAKLVFGESISQTNQFILSSAAEIGITAYSVIKSPAAQGKGRWFEADPSLYQPIAQGAVVIKSSAENVKNGKDFVEFLRSPDGREILHKFGYGLDAVR